MCGEIVRKGYLKEHLESKHLGMKYSCHECELEARSKQQLRRHVVKKHLGITYRCDECDYQSRAKEDLCYSCVFCVSFSPCFILKRLSQSWFL